MKSIGGYFELELSEYDNFPHKSGIFLNSGRNALEYILISLNIKKIKIPYFTCDVVLEPLKKLSIEYDYYNINQDLEMDDGIILQDDEYLLVNNYFGIKDHYIEKLFCQYGSRLIIDNSQALYARHIDGANIFYSPRKYIGIPDGGIAFIAGSVSKQEYEKDYSYDKCSHLLKRLDYSASFGYLDFKNNSKKLSNQDIREMSDLTFKLIKSVDFEYIRNKRIENFRYLNKFLAKTNKIKIPDMDTFICPMVYPYCTNDSGLKQRLIMNNIFVATYWPNVLECCDELSIEHHLAESIVCLPIDQRYDNKDMNLILSFINK